jgi:predicted dehydrogenase
MHSKALHEYVPRPYPGKITLFRSSETAQADSDDSPWSWKALAGGGLEIHRFDAAHNIVDDQYVEAVAGKLQECLVQAQGG